MQLDAEDRPSAALVEAANRCGLLVETSVGMEGCVAAGCGAQVRVVRHACRWADDRRGVDGRRRVWSLPAVRVCGEHRAERERHVQRGVGSARGLGMVLGSPADVAGADWEQVADTTRRHLESWRLDHGPLVLHGSTGVGKSCVAALLARAAAADGATVQWEAHTAWVSDRRGERGDPLAVGMQRVVAASVVVLDDVGAEHPTEFGLAQLYELLARRSGRPLVVTTNHDLEGLAEWWSSARDGLEMARRLVSRFAAMRWVTVSGADRRLVAAAQRDGAA